MQGVLSSKTVHRTVLKFTLCGAPYCIRGFAPHPTKGAASGLCRREIFPLETQYHYYFCRRSIFDLLMCFLRKKRLHLSMQPCACTNLNYSLILVTTPEPTVLPPSRIAKRSPSSIAIGVISSTSIETLSPGIHISLSAGSVTTPVTSVVLK